MIRALATVRAVSEKNLTDAESGNGAIKNVEQSSDLSI